MAGLGLQWSRRNSEFKKVRRTGSTSPIWSESDSFKIPDQQQAKNIVHDARPNLPLLSTVDANPGPRCSWRSPQRPHKISPRRRIIRLRSRPGEQLREAQNSAATTVERWHKPLKSECILPGTPLSLENARRLVEGYVEHYNNVRLNSVTGYITPKDLLAEHQQEIHAERDRKLEAARQQRQSHRQQAA
ncbi:MAG TPA: integrase core domain-containing protein [Terriglobales bacterium]|nr:integrase core domain-containing protein [Terriglobales bacterium]